MTDVTKVSISPLAIAELESVVREALEARVNFLERRLLLEIDRRIRLERACAEKDETIERLSESTNAD